MAPRSFRVDPGASKLVLRTRAVGLLARLAHDLEIVATDLRGHGGPDGDGWTGELSVPVASLRVAGALKGEMVDPSVLSGSDRAEIERRVREEVLVGGSEVVVKAKGASRDRGEVTVTLGASSARVKVTLATADRQEGAVDVKGRCELSLRGLGGQEVKGPLGAFKVSDTIEVLFDLVLVPEA